MPDDVEKRLSRALWRLHRRPERPEAWHRGGNLPWNDPAFSERMLREHLDPSHGAASRPPEERRAQLTWLWNRLDLAPGRRVYDVTCGPGLYAVELARRGCPVTGVDFAPASLAHAERSAADAGVSHRCRFLESDVRTADPGDAAFDAALLLYGQLAVFPRNDALLLLRHVHAHLAPGGRLCVELLDSERVDRSDATWWFTDDTGLWGDAPFLHLGERSWDAATGISTERYHILHLETGEMDEILLSDQTYTTAEARALFAEAGFTDVEVVPAWDGLPLRDADEWIVYVATR